MNGGGLDLFLLVAAIGLEALCEFNDQTKDVVRIAFQGFANDSILSEGLTGGGTIDARSHRLAPGVNGTHARSV
jgi:hypothetical protein